MFSAQKEALAKLTRQTYVIGIYRWLIEVAFLFAAFTAFPAYKWPIGLGMLVFSGGVSAIVHVTTISHQAANVLADAGERKTRHTILHAAELAARGETHIEEWDFWGEVDQRVSAEQTARDGSADKPTGFWAGLGLASGALIFQLIANLFGIALVAALTTY